ncbi:hypothetical protein CSB45_14880 [candidate division KSB3 bacterium]|uniref:Uncharacterized protein n=1 Tax=candidate division KSB3 bacterium TaxID=2044937 RepID=A0A2G6E1P6_9BACT|nr:MAG: hypothetical protein CSB45_14880 [candidate division KSB3 bacterium]PIE28352.1 MAG: hypothetical protein CSA57_14360 [candidate division KSB3 bacterium]
MELSPLHVQICSIYAKRLLIKQRRTNPVLGNNAQSFRLLKNPATSHRRSQTPIKTQRAFNNTININTKRFFTQEKSYIFFFEKLKYFLMLQGKVQKIAEFTDATLCAASGGTTCC